MELIEFRLSERSGVPTYLQLVQQVRQAIRLGLLRPGDQLPTVKEVVGRLAINPNTVLKAYRELDHEGLVVARRGQGTFVSDALEPAVGAAHAALQAALVEVLDQARRAGLEEEDVTASFAAAIESVFAKEVR
jgi:GntR family transcriptional regulator